MFEKSRSNVTNIRPGGQPIPEANTALLRAFHASNPGGQIRAKQPGICSLISEAANSGEPQIDSGRCVMECSSNPGVKQPCALQQSHELPGGISDTSAG